MTATDIVSKAFWNLVPRRLKRWREQIKFVRNHYRTKMNRELNLFRPIRFSEKMQWRKLFEASALHTQLSDKIAMRDFVASKGFSSLLMPQLWIGDDPLSMPLRNTPRPFVIKSSHASGQIIMVWPNQHLSFEKIFRGTTKWLNYCHGTALVEPGYLGVPHQLIIEPLLQCADGSPPAELKVFVFHGVAKFVQYVRISRNRRHTARYFSRDWDLYFWRGEQYSPPIGPTEKPANFEFALTVAEKICENMEHCRVDFYLKDDRIYIGELTMYAFSGMALLKPDYADDMMGSYWKIRWPVIRAIKAIVFRDWGQ